MPRTSPRSSDWAGTREPAQSPDLGLVEPKPKATALTVRFRVENEDELLGAVEEIEPGDLDPMDTLPEGARAAIYDNEFKVSIAGGHLVDNVARYYDGVSLALKALPEFEALELGADVPDLSRCKAYRAGGIL